MHALNSNIEKQSLVMNIWTDFDNIPRRAAAMAAVLASFEGASVSGIFTADDIYTWLRLAQSARNLNFGLDDLKRAFYDLASRNIVDDLASPYAFVWTICQTKHSINVAEGIRRSRTIQFPLNISRRDLVVHMCKIGEDEKAAGMSDINKQVLAQPSTAHRLACILFVIVV
jgi:hypothetical protein